MFLFLFEFLMGLKCFVVFSVSSHCISEYRLVQVLAVDVNTKLFHGSAGESDNAIALRRSFLVKRNYLKLI